MCIYTPFHNVMRGAGGLNIDIYRIYAAVQDVSGLTCPPGTRVE